MAVASRSQDDLLRLGVGYRGWMVQKTMQVKVPTLTSSRPKVEVVNFYNKQPPRTHPTPPSVHHPLSTHGTVMYTIKYSMSLSDFHSSGSGAVLFERCWNSGGGNCLLSIRSHSDESASKESAQSNPVHLHRNISTMFS